MTSTAVRYSFILTSSLFQYRLTPCRVGLRVRPLTQKEQLSNCAECISFIPNEPQILLGTDKSFTYDYVFSNETRQEEVYQKAAAPLLEKFVEG
jgi:hypothetical protein